MSSAEAGSDDLCRPSIVISQEKETEKLSNNNIFDKSTSINQDNWNMTIRSIDSNFTSCSQLSVTSSVSMIQSVASNQSTVYVVDAFSAGIIGDYSRNNDITETSSGTNENIYSRHINGDISSNFSSHGIPSDIYLEFSDTSSISRTAKSYGKTIDENHVNFVLMYDMLTGIRHSVSACQAKPLKFIEESDFKYSRTYNFVSDSNETTPSKYEFRFKDYCPWVFRSLREAFKIDAADYLVSIIHIYFF